jgi:hypothetical protein
MNRTQLDRHPEDTSLATALHVVANWPGARVLPVDGKHPVYTEVPHGSTDASNDPEQIAAWFSGTSYGVGVTGVLAIDGDDLDLTFESFPDCLTTGVQVQGNPLRATFLFAQTDTPFGDGKHPGGEVKGSGYVVLPPSPHVSEDCASCANGPHPYLWLSDWDTLPVLPPEIEAILDGMVRRQGDRPKPIDAMPDGWMSAGDPCRAVTRLVAPLTASLAKPGVAKYPHIQGPLLELLRLGEQGHSGVMAAAIDLRTAYVAACDRESSSRGRVAGSEFQRSLWGAIGRIHADGLTDVYDRGCCAPEVDTSIIDRVFNATDELKHVRAWAQARRVGPWAVLGGVLARAVAEVEPMLHLPPYVGDDASLNLYVGLVDQSGAGKSAGYKASARAFLGMVSARHVPNGTGEGLIESFIQKSSKADIEAGAPKRRVHDNPQVLMYVDEIGQLQTGSDRKGATIDPVLRSMWNGEEVGTNNADEDRHRHLPEHTYRLCLVAGVQPGLAGSLLNGQATASGTAQRWLWLPVADPHAPEERPDLPAVLTWKSPGRSPHVRHVEFPPDIRSIVDEARLKTLRGIDVSEADKVRAHENLMHMKVGAALAVLHGTTVVDDLLWAVAGDIMEVSSRTRAGVLRTLAAAEERTQLAKGRAASATERGRREADYDDVERVAVMMWRRIDRHADEHPDGCSMRCLSQAIGRNAEWKVRALELARDREWITVVEGAVNRFVKGPSQPTVEGV